MLRGVAVKEIVELVDALIFCGREFTTRDSAPLTCNRLDGHRGSCIHFGSTARFTFEELLERDKGHRRSSRWKSRWSPPPAPTDITPAAKPTPRKADKGFEDWLRDLKRDLRGFPSTRRRAKPWPEMPDRSPTVFVEGIGWLNHRESMVWSRDDLTLWEARSRSGAWCDTDWDARFDDSPLQMAALNDGSAVQVLSRAGRVRLPKIVPWVDDDWTYKSWR